MQKPEISGKAFWDVRLETIEFDKQSLYVMEKVFNYGDWADQLTIMRFYGLQRVKNEIVNAGYLREPVVSFLAAVLQLQKKDFKCYMKMQSHPLPWIY